MDTQNAQAGISLQAEPMKVLDDFFAQYGSFIVEGCKITANGTLWNVAPGTVALTGTDHKGANATLVVPFEGAQSTTLPLYLTLAHRVIEKPSADGRSKLVTYAYYAAAATGAPAPDTAHFTLDHYAPRFCDALQDETHRFVSDAEKAAWNARETPGGAQTKATAALNAANDYTDTCLQGKANLNGDVNVDFRAKELRGQTCQLVSTETLGKAYLHLAKESPSASKLVLGTHPSTSNEQDAMEISNGEVHVVNRATIAGNEALHKGNFDTETAFVRRPKITSQALEGNDTVGMPNGVCGVDYHNEYTGLLVNFTEKRTSASPLQILLDGYFEASSLQWRSGVDCGSFQRKFRTLYDNYNLTAATPDKDGLMSQEQCRKLNGLNLKVGAAGLLNASGETETVYNGSWEKNKMSNGDLLITHNIGSTKYMINVTGYSGNSSVVPVTVTEKAANYVRFSIGDASKIEFFLLLFA